MSTLATLTIALALALFMLGITVAFATAWREIAKLMTLVGLWREGRQFFKKIERFRRDFSK